MHTCTGKVELHCHLLGVISPEILDRIRRNGDPILVDPENLRAAYPVLGAIGFTRWLEILGPYQRATPGYMRPILGAHITELIRQNVVYAEIMISPTMFSQDLNTMLKEFEQWREWTLDLEGGRIQVEYIMVVPRSLHQDFVDRDTLKFIELHRAGLIVGVAVVGLEDGKSIERFAHALNTWREAGLGIEIHAGEHTSSGSIRDTLKYGYPNRIGHGLSIFDDAELVDDVRQRNIHIEFCPSSNLCTGAVSDLRDHPLKRALDLGVSFSINTDDPGAFECSVCSEHQLSQDAFGFTPDDFKTIYTQSLAARFQPRLRHLHT